MELAFHLKNPDQKQVFHTFLEHVANFYENSLFENSCSDYQFPEYYSRIYIGDEFCEHRVPGLKELKKFCRFADDEKLAITFLTPFLTDKGLEKIVPLFDYLMKNCPETEVIVNDWGVLLFLKRDYPKFKLGIGRLLNKGFKDPRLKKHKQTDFFEQQDQILLDCTFQNPGFQEKIIKLGVSCLEQDLFPYANLAQLGNLKNREKLNYSFYFPFGYITTGRACLTATFNQQKNQRFVPQDKCSEPCNKQSFELKNQYLSFRIFQNGNTLFYLYTFLMLDSLIKKAKQKNIRLIYQGFII